MTKNSKGGRRGCNVLMHFILLSASSNGILIAF